MLKILLFVLLPVVCSCQLLISNPQEKKKADQRKLIFEGNSLMCNTNVAFANYVPLGVYASLRTSGYTNLSYSSYAVGGQTQPLINAKLPTHYTPYLKPSDIVFLWEGTASINGKTAADCIIDLQTFITAINATGAKLIISTIIAREQTGAPADEQQRLIDYNTWVRANTASGYYLCDLGAMPEFNEMADASNLTYYNPDKLHTTDAGKDIQMPVIAASFVTALTTP